MAAPTGRSTPGRLHPLPDLPPTITPDLVQRLCSRVVASTSSTLTTVAVPTGQPYVDLPQSTVDDVRSAVVHARKAQVGWAAMPLRERVDVLSRFAELAFAETAPILDLIQTETGKARWHAYQEALEPVLTASYYARKATRILRPKRREGMLPGLVKTVQCHQPVGVVGIVSPWNYPFALGISDALTALVAGNAVVLKPDTQTALSPLFGVELLYRAGLPDGVLQPVLGDGPLVGVAVVEQTDYIGFTGSSRTGKDVAQRAGSRLVGCSLELGGKNAMLVLDDAPLNRTVAGAVQACFTNAGQLCLSTERVYVHRRVYNEFVARFVEQTRKLRLGNEYGFGPQVGSLTLARQLDTVSDHVEDARAKGATIHAGGRARLDIGPYFYEPTVLTGVTPAMRCHGEETFGPVVAIYPFTDEEDAIRMANDTEFGLNASVYTRDIARGQRIAARLRTGTVNINDGFVAAYGSMDAPMGGFGASGLGRRHGTEGLLKYTEAQTIATQRLSLLTPPKWFSVRWYAKVMSAMIRLLNKLGIR